MSTRKGTVIFLEQIIYEAESVMHGHMRKNEEKYAAVEDTERTRSDMAAKRGATIHSLSARLKTSRSVNSD